MTEKRRKHKYGRKHKKTKKYRKTKKKRKDNFLQQGYYNICAYKRRYGFDLDGAMLAKRCNQKLNDIMKEGNIIFDGGSQFSFIDKNSDILAVAHCDTVQNENFCVEVYDGKKKRLEYHSPKLDDRLGVYVILDLLPKLGINTDVLLTTDEEIGASTAQYFQTDKKYKWIVEFDRRGDDVVVYDVNDELEQMLSEFWDIGFGSFSDIAFMPDITSAKFNVGVGYYDAHGMSAHMIVDEFMDQIKTFIKFYKKYKDTTLPVGTSNTWYTRTYGDYYSGYYYNGVHDVYKPNREYTYPDTASEISMLNNTELTDETIKLLEEQSYADNDYTDLICQSNSMYIDGNEWVWCNFCQDIVCPDTTESNPYATSNMVQCPYCGELLKLSMV